MIGFAMCGSFCTLGKAQRALEALCAAGYEVMPVMSECCYSTDTRFGAAAMRAEAIERLCGKKIISTIAQAEAFGPQIHTDALVIAPCTGNTLAKLSYGITDSAVTMAAKAHLRNQKPLVIALATNDALGANLKNIGHMMERKNVFFVPMGQDDYVKKPASMIADFSKIEDALLAALDSKQLQPLFIT